jgi:uncharacterized protein (DUF2141 family)
MRWLMKKIILLSILVYNLFGFDLTVKVNNLRNSKGIVQFSLYNQEGSIPDQDYKKYFKQTKINITNNSAKVIFTNLKKGIYAVNILHDENKNGKIDKGFLLPKEGIGFSNYDKINLMNKPNFKKASFLIDKNKTIKIKTIYF